MPIRWVAWPIVCGLSLMGLAGDTQQRRVSLLVVGGTIVTMNPDRRVEPSGAVAVDGDEIVFVGSTHEVESRYTAENRIDATGQIVMPGLVNTHTHAPMVMYRGLADDRALSDWLENYIFPAEARTVSPEFVKTGTRLATLEMIRSGTTTYADMYYFEDAIAEATTQAGLRAVLGQTIIKFPAPDAATPAEALARAERFIVRWRDDGLITPAVAPHAVYSLEPDMLQAARTLASRYEVPVLIHLAETQDELRTTRRLRGATPTVFLESLGFWGPRTVAAHVVWADDEDIAILRRRGVGVSHNPESNMKLASGAAPVSRMRAAGVTVGIGTDGAASNNDLDMFEAMRHAALLGKLQTGDPSALGAVEVLAMATIEGARALGLEGQIGSLEEGKKADMLIVAMDAPRQTPMYDPVSHLVYATHGDDVGTTIVNGRVLMSEGRVVTLDEDAVLAEARALAARVRDAVRPLQ